MPQPRSVAAAAGRHADDWNDADQAIRRIAARILRGARPSSREIIGGVRRITARLEERAAEWASTELRGVYRLGAKVAADVTGIAATEALMDAEVAQILAEHVDDTARVAAGLRRAAASFVVPDGLPVLTPAEIAALSPGELRDLLRNPIGLVRYTDGSFRTVADHGDMLTRTRASLTFNAGTIANARITGSDLVVVRDGVGCGITAHEDGTTANGQVWDLDFAAAHPLAHPRCQRSFQPLPPGTSPRRAAKVAAEASLLPLDAPLPPVGPVVQPRPRRQRSRPSRATRSKRVRRR